MKTKNQLDPQQSAAVLTLRPSVVVIAGPGSGKTEVLRQRVEQVAHVGPVAVVTLTNSAADEIRERMDPACKPWHLGTIHSLALKIVTAVYAATGDVTVLSADEGEDLEQEAIKRIGHKVSGKAFAAGKKMLLETGSFEVLSRDLGLALKSWAQIQVANLAFTFDGLLYWANQGLAIYRPVISHLIVDEAQDCCAADFAMFENLRPVNTFMVGDPDQNIFAWRGSSVDQFINATTKTETTQCLELETNYRCPVRVCAVANNLISYNRQRVKKLTEAVVGAPEGRVALAEYDTFGSEMLVLRERIDECQAHGETYAVLCRTNLVRGMVREALGLPEDESELLPPDWATARILLTFLAAPMNSWNAAKAAVVVGEDKELKRMTRFERAECIRRTYGDMTRKITWATALNWLGDAGMSPASIVRIRNAATGDGPTPDWLVELDESQPRSKSPVMTIHAAKGREFDVVFLPCFDSDEIPGRTEIEEARRLAFVALTRARLRVLISYSLKRKSWGGKTVNVQQSPFIAEMGSETLLINMI